MGKKPRQIIASMLLAADTYIDLKEVFGEWINFPGANLGSGYAAGWQAQACGSH